MLEYRKFFRQMPCLLYCTTHALNKLNIIFNLAFKCSAFFFTFSQGQAIASATMAEQIFSNTVGIEGASFSMEVPPQCPQLNVSMCHFTEGENDQVLIALYNPLPRSRDIRLR